ncbi:MAG: hypothetical protein HXX08_09150 [Chloroflexi bacterium]|uniref:Uncharacterized protein n=1 Tax=Candidatus Chlorohelix allophototropha TaxID=3003348 RepID=A0A8T7M1Q9_9CHLR|nr:hypothetical protein [Chloroflexota bacterium]WJW67890.1 hypothetical protein OZ401_001174 [Chloroflexota bacterium L227-S17]
MEKVTGNSIKSRPNFALFTRIGAVALLVFIVAGALFVIMNQQSPKPTQTNVPPMPTNPQIEEKWGIRVTQIGVTADGGMVDFRFMVIDPEKALNMMSVPDNLPILAAEDSGIYVNSAAIMSTRHDLNAGGIYFMLFRNTQGAIKPGGKVVVLFPDEQKLEHVVAR